MTVRQGDIRRAALLGEGSMKLRFVACARRAIGFTVIAALIGAIGAGASVTANAQDADFFKSHKLTLGAPSNAGGGYDTYPRLISRHMAKHISGNPTIIVQNVPA